MGAVIYREPAAGPTQGSLAVFDGRNWQVLAAGTSGQVLTADPADAANPAGVKWAAAGGSSLTLTTTGSSGVATFSGGTLNVPNYATSPGGTAGEIQYNSGGSFGGSAKLSVGAAGQLNYAAIAAPGSPAAGDAWYDSTQLCRAWYDGLPAYRVGLIYSQVAVVTITASGPSTVISTAGAVGTDSLPAGFLNVAGRTLRIAVRGFGTTPASGQGNLYAFVKLGSNVIATGGSSALTPSKTAVEWQIDLVVTTKATGTSGTLDSQGLFESGQTGGASLLTPVQISNGTSAGTYAPGTQVALDLTQAYTLDVQLNLTASTNTFVVTNVLVEVLG